MRDAGDALSILDRYQPIANPDRCAFAIAAWDTFIDLGIVSRSHRLVGKNAGL